LKKILIGFAFLITLIFLGYYFISTKISQNTLPFQLSNQVNVSIKNFKWKAYNSTTPEQAKQFALNRREALAYLLSPDIDTYKGTDTTPLKCQLDSLPKPLFSSDKEGFSEAYSLYSSDSMVLGFCGDERHLMKTQYQILYCVSKKTTYILQFFYSDEQEWLKTPLAKCL
jgi:hypothetical protein